MTTELAWCQDAAPLTCPVCRFDGPGTQIAEVNALGREGIEVVRCPTCGSVQMSGEIGDVTPDDASIDAYVEAGAGIDAIAAGIDVAHPEQVRRMLDVGCNYGFGLDLGRFLHGWETVGVEPSAAGRRGARELGLEIRDEYLTESTRFTEPFDLVLASEVLEHVRDPHQFLRTLAGHLTADGILVLTTPAAEVVVPTTESELVLIALSPGFHGFLASRDGLETMLAEAGFRSISVRQDGGTLRARASLATGVLLDRSDSGDVDRLAVERYYDHRTSTAAPGSALRNGMATRHLRSVVNRGDFTAAEPSAHRAVAALRERHGFDLDRPDEVARSLANGVVPAWNLVGAGYALGMLELLGRQRPARAVEYFDLVLTGIEAWRRHAGLLDGDSADLRPHAARHRALAVARADPDGAAAALTAAEAVLGVPASALLRLQLFTELVTAGEHVAAEPFVTEVAATVSRISRVAVGGERRTALDALYTLATHAAATGDHRASQAWSASARHALLERPADDHSSVLLTALDEHDALLERIRADAAAHAESLTPGHGTHGASAPVPAPGPAHMIDAYWVDASGTYLRGWAHAGAEPVVSVTLHRGPASVTQAPTERPDLQRFWPDVPAVVRSGFDLYLPGPPDGPVDLEVTTTSGSVRSRLTLPAHPLPQPAADHDARAFSEAISSRLADAPPGPVLAVGLRATSTAQRDLMVRVLGGRELVVADIHPGPGVDLIADAHDLAASTGGRRFAVVFSAMLLEHVVAPWMVAAQVNAVLLPGGLSAHVAPTAWPEHAQPNDFWRFTTAGLAELFGPRTGFEVLDSGSYGELRLHPTASWVQGQEGMATLATPGSSWIVSRKTAELAADAVRWPYDRAQGVRIAQEYPVDGLAPTTSDWLLAGLPVAVMPTAAEPDDAPPARPAEAPAPAGTGSVAPAEPSRAPELGPAPVSVVLPLHNGRQYVLAAIESVARQTVLPTELVVVDDGSSDGGRELLLDLELPFPLTIITQPNQGQSAARNTGARAARSELIAFIDQDDAWRRQHLELLVPMLVDDPELGWVYSDFDELDDLGRTVTHSFIRERSVPHPKSTLGSCLSGDLMVLPSASVLRTSALDSVGGFDPRLQGYEDDDLFVRIFAAGWGHAFVPASTLRYRVHPAGSSAGGSFLRSRMIYLDKLVNELQVDHRLNRDFVHDVVLPRFFQATLNDYTQAIAMREYGRALELASALTTIAGLEQRRGWRRRLELAFIRHPRRFRFVLIRLGRLPRWLRPTLNPVLNLTDRTAVRAELRTR